MPNIHQLRAFLNRPALGNNGDPAFKPAKPVDHDEAICMMCPWEDPFAGFPTHARRIAWAIHHAGQPIHVRSLTLDGSMVAGADQAACVERMRPLTDVTVARFTAYLWMVVPSPSLVANIASHPFLSAEDAAIVNRHRILYTVWERQTLDPFFGKAMRQLGQCWVACQDNADLLVREAGVERERVHVVPCPYDARDPLATMPGRPRRPGPPKFVHVGKWEPRKAQHEIIGAFLRAFKPREAVLLLKTNSRGPRAQLLAGYPASPEESIARWLEDERVGDNGWTADNVKGPLLVIKRFLPPAQMRELHAVADAYVTLSRGEGFDMPAFDAALAGNLLVYTPSGGPQDFADPDDIRVPTSGLTDAHPYYRWSPGTKYLDFDIDEAVAALQMAATRIRSGDARHRNDRLAPFEMGAVGARIRALLKDIGS